MQKRSYPNSVGRHQGTEGWEFVRRYDLAGNAQRVAEEAAALLRAKPCPPGVKDIILDGSQVALQIHESCGHAIELDRVFGTEAAFAATSFLTTEKLGGFRYGSDIVNLTADATIPGGLGTFGYDDEGVAAQYVPVVRKGLFLGYLTSRETARQLQRRSDLFGVAVGISSVNRSQSRHPTQMLHHPRPLGCHAPRLEPSPHPHDQRRPRAGRLPSKK